MDNQAFMDDMATILDVDASELTPDFQLDSERFDSVALVGTIAAIDDHFGITVDARVLRTCSTFGELTGLIEAKVGA